MPNWEYHFEQVSGLTVPVEQQRKSTEGKIQARGGQGWELVTILSERGTLWGIFKRPAPESPAAQPARPQIGLKDRLVQ